MNLKTSQQTPSQKNNEKYVVGLEVGSSQAKIGIAGFDPENKRRSLTVYNMASLPTVDSVRYGRIVNIRDVYEVIVELVGEIEKKYPIENRNIIGTYISIGGRSFRSESLNAEIVLPIRSEITEDHMSQLQEKAINSLQTSDRLVSVIPARYSVDNIPAPRPIGSLGKRLSGEFTAVVCSRVNMDDLVDVLNDRVGISMRGLSVRPIALAQLVLTRSEMNAGCMLVDFGAETTTVLIFRNNALKYLATLPVGSRLITKDLASAMSLTEENAEQVKIQYGNAMPTRDDIVDDPKTQKAVNEVVLARLADIVININEQPKIAGFDKISLPAGIILAGGGSKMHNFAKLLEKEIGMKVRIATLPRDIVINDPAMSSPDNLDLMALLCEAADASKDIVGSECVAIKEDLRSKAEETELWSAKEGGFTGGHGDRPQGRNSDVVVNVNAKESRTQGTKINTEVTNPMKTDHNESGDLIMTDKDDYEDLEAKELQRNLKKEEKDRIRALTYLKRQQEVAKRKAQLEEQKRLEAEERAAQQAQKTTDDQSKPPTSTKTGKQKFGFVNRIENIINNVTGYITSQADDNSFDFDDYDE